MIKESTVWVVMVILHTLSKLDRCMEEKVASIIKLMPYKMCELDPILVDLLKQALDGLLPTLTKNVNSSLSTATFAKSQKVALIKLLLKKIGLELIKSNYRPVSN